MGSRDKDQPASRHQPLLSSLVVRPSSSGDGGGGGGDGVSGGRAAGSDYDSGDDRRDPLPPYRSDRYSDDTGFRIRAGSVSPAHHRNAERRYSPDLDRPPRGREFVGRREPGRFRDSPPHYGRGRGGRPYGRGFDGPGLGPRPFRGEVVARNNPNVRPRDGDWYCADLSCGNLNFARRDSCNNCNRPRSGHRGSPRRGYLAPPPSYAASRRFPGPPSHHSPPRSLNGYRSPPRSWVRDGPRDFGSGGLPPPRHEVGFSDDYMRREHVDYPEDDYRGRSRFDRPMPTDWAHRDRGRDSFVSEGKNFDRRPLSPPLHPPPLPAGHDRWARDIRERSRSPIRGALPQKDYRRDLYMERGRDDRHGLGRGRIGDPY
ncbi:hypothetical protein BT93_C0598 [Corymbia citriodora subsp. variegata]|nr:hypothetical protein BT93_C0598 [Corymbia citriodora subsp. variegata]